MKPKHGLVLLLALLLFSCQSRAPSHLTIIDNDTILTLQTKERIPELILASAGIKLNANDRLLVNGLPVKPDQPITNLPITDVPITNLPITTLASRNSPLTIQIHRASAITIETPDGQKQIQSSAFTVAEALRESSLWLYAGDEYSPALNTPLSHLQGTFPWDQHPVVIKPKRPIVVTANGELFQVNSAARTVGEALAHAGIPLLGLDYSFPAEDEPVATDGQIKIVRVAESVLLAQKPIPFGSELQASAEVPLDQTQILQPGETGLSVARVRVRYEDGDEVARITEDEIVVRPPQTRILGYGTKIEVKAAVVDGVRIEYWRSVEMYATSYSPCRLGTSTCGSTTASGKQLRKGMVAVNRTLYFNMLGQPLFIPGYGRATIEDLCGGCVGKPWIDLGFTDANFEPWHQWVTVYFLTPVPANIIYVLE